MSDSLRDAASFAGGGFHHIAPYGAPRPKPPNASKIRISRKLRCQGDRVRYMAIATPMPAIKPKPAPCHREVVIGQVQSRKTPTPSDITIMNTTTSRRPSNDWWAISGLCPPLHRNSNAHSAAAATPVRAARRAITNLWKLIASPTRSEVVSLLAPHKASPRLRVANPLPDLEPAKCGGDHPARPT